MPGRDSLRRFRTTDEHLCRLQLLNLSGCTWQEFNDALREMREDGKMSKRRYVVPEGMLKAALSAYVIGTHQVGVRDALEAALRWLAENPIVPTEKEAADLVVWSSGGTTLIKRLGRACIEWQRRMFLAPEPVVPEDVAAMLVPNETSICGQIHNKRLVEAYELGRQAGAK